jgi:hypothetical protein
MKELLLALLHLAAMTAKVVGPRGVPVVSRLSRVDETLSPRPRWHGATLAVVHRTHERQPVERGSLSMRVDRAPELLSARGHGRPMPRTTPRYERANPTSAQPTPNRLRVVAAIPEYAGRPPARSTAFALKSKSPWCNSGQPLTFRQELGHLSTVTRGMSRMTSVTFRLSAIGPC